jgi:hypothetical protein
MLYCKPRNAQADKIDDAEKAAGGGKGGRATCTSITTPFEKTRELIMAEYAEIYNLPRNSMGLLSESM